VANELISSNPDKIQRQRLQKDAIYKFITTSRKVEDWLQRVEEDIQKMGRENEPVELWMIIGGYGSGKSHVKKYLLRRTNKNLNVDYLDLDVTDLSESGNNNVFSLVLFNSIKNLDALYDAINNNSSSGGVREKLRQHQIDSDFIKIFSEYEEARSENNNNFKPLEEYILNKGRQIYLPLMKLYKEYLGLKGICIFIDEFEGLQNFESKTRDSFIASIRAFYDMLASAHLDSDSPSFKMVVLCSLPFWNEIREDVHIQALESRLKLFEIPPLFEDELIALAEKLYALYNRSGVLGYNTSIDFTKISSYLVGIAGIESPLTPRFVIEQIIYTIESPEEYLKYYFQSP
jgi:hypothetical protein